MSRQVIYQSAEIEAVVFDTPFQRTGVLAINSSVGDDLLVNVRMERGEIIVLPVGIIRVLLPKVIEVFSANTTVDVTTMYVGYR